MGIADDEFESLREQLAKCSAAEREKLVASLVSQGKLEQTATGVKYALVERWNLSKEAGAA